MKRSVFTFLLFLFLLPCIVFANEMGYDSLLARGGERQQDFYLYVLDTLSSFGSSEKDAPEDMIIFSCTPEDAGLTSDQMVEAIQMVFVDHPEIYFTSSEMINQYSSLVQIQVIPECAAAQDRRIIEEKINNCTEQLLSQMSQKELGSAYDKARAVHDAIIELTTYDLEAPMQHTIAGVMADGRAVCDGYAKAYKYLLDKLGVYSLVVIGDAGEPHAWNLIQMEDGSWITADLTWDDFGGVSHTYFDMSAAVFAMSHKASTPEGTASDYYFELPDLGIPEEPQTVSVEGMWEDQGEPITSDMSYEQVMARMTNVCSRAVSEGKGSFSIAVNEDAVENVTDIMSATLNYAEKTVYFFDLHMQEDINTAGVYAGLTGDVQLSSGRMIFSFYIWDQNTVTPSIKTYADGRMIGVYHTIAQAYAACSELDAQTLTMELSAAELYALPVFSSAPEDVFVSLRGDHAFANMVTCGPVTFAGDMELCNIRLISPPATVLDIDLDNHALILGDRIEIGYANINKVFGDPDFSNQSRIHGGEGSKLINDRGAGTDTIRDVYAVIDVDEMILREGNLSLRGTGNQSHVNTLRVEETGGYSILSVGVNETIDSVSLQVEVYENTGAYLDLSSAEGQTIVINSVRPADESKEVFGGIHLSCCKYSEVLNGDLWGLPDITIGGPTDIYIYYYVQYTVPGTYTDVAMAEVVPLGTVLLHAPEIQTIDTSYYLCTNNGSVTSDSGKFEVAKDENGNIVVAGYTE